MPPNLRPADFWDPEQLQGQSYPVLTSGQLHLLRQQIDDLRRLNVQLRELKYKARTGRELTPTAARPAVGSGRRGGGCGRTCPAAVRLDVDGCEHILIGGRGRGRGRRHGRGRVAKRGREDEGEDDDSIVAQSNEEEEELAVGASCGEEEQAGGSDESESAVTSESEEDYTLPTMTAPRRTGRMRRPSCAAAAIAGMVASEEEQQKSGAGDMEQQQQQQAGAAVPELSGLKKEEQEGGGPSSTQGARPVIMQACSGKSGAGSQGAKRQGLFMLVSDTAASRTLQLPHLKAVRVAQQAAGSEDSGGDGEEEDVVCTVCGDGDAVEGNVILLCEGKGCSVAVHQMCYGVAKVPEGKWVCDACNGGLKPSAGNCCVCPVVGSALKKVTSLGRVMLAGKPKTVYCHLACALWVPEIELADHEHMAGVRLDKLTAVRARLKCELCKQAGGGVIQCAFGTCWRSFHVLCGRGAGQTLTFRTHDGEPLAFCDLHSKPAFEKMVEEMVDERQPLEPHNAMLKV